MTRLVPPDMRPHFTIRGKAKRKLTEPQARALAARDPGSKRRPNDAYQCPICGAWHVGRRPPKGKRSRCAA